MKQMESIKDLKNLPIIFNDKIIGMVDEIIVNTESSVENDTVLKIILFNEKYSELLSNGANLSIEYQFATIEAKTEKSIFTQDLLPIKGICKLKCVTPRALLVVENGGELLNVWTETERLTEENKQLKRSLAGMEETFYSRELKVSMQEKKIKKEAVRGFANCLISEINNRGDYWDRAKIAKTIFTLLEVYENDISKS